jgi:hypothetical protein
MPHFVFVNILNSYQNCIMPYRRLPTTDQARKRAIEQALEMGRKKIPVELSFAQHTHEKLLNFYPAFEKVLTTYRKNTELLEEKNTDYESTLYKARLYLSHFVQVLNLAIERQEINWMDREFYGFGAEDNFIPPLNLEQEIIGWGEKIIEGEQVRVRAGGNPIYSPSIALVKVHYDQFLKEVNFRKNLQAEIVDSLEQVTKMRNKADLLILDLWNEIELHYQYLAPNAKRQRATDYGIVYVYRQNELSRAEQEELQTNLFFGI